MDSKKGEKEERRELEEERRGNELRGGKCVRRGRRSKREIGEEEGKGRARELTRTYHELQSFIFTSFVVN